MFRLETAKKVKNADLEPKPDRKPRKNPPKKTNVAKSPGVIKLTGIPHGFYEKEMWSYFSQFGKVKRIRLARSRKTCQSKGFAFIEFAYDEVAKIAAEAMDNYLMFDKILRCRYLPPDEVRPGTFPKLKKILPSRIVYAKKYNKVQSQKHDVPLEEQKKKINKVKQKLAELGIQFDFDLKESCEQKSGANEGRISELHCSPSQPVTPMLAKLPAETEVPCLVIDSSDDELSFKTPPNTFKVRKSKMTSQNLPSSKRKSPSKKKKTSCKSL